MSRVVTGAARRPRPTVAAVAVLAALGALVALGLRPQASIGTFVSSSTAVYRATVADGREFGAAPVVILVREPVRELLGSSDLQTLSRLEACLDGRSLQFSSELQALVPVRAGAAPDGGAASPCGALMRSRPAHIVYGPGTFVNVAVAAVSEQLSAVGTATRRAIAQAERTAYALALRRGLSRKLARTAALAAGELEEEQEVGGLLGLALGAGVTSAPSIDNAAFLDSVVFGPDGGPAPEARFAYLFPTADSALIQVRLDQDLTAAQQSRAIALIRRAVATPRFRLAHGSYLVSGEPVLLSDLTAELASSIVAPLLAGLAFMALALALLFGGRRRLVPLIVAVAAAAITFGLARVAGAGLTIASIAALPVLIGLGVDYAVQFQSRAREADGLSPELAVGVAGRAGAPTIAVAALATAAGFLVLLLSPVPMVRGFGTLLVAGVAVALAVTFTAGAALLALEGPGARRTRRVRPPLVRLPLGASLRGAAEILGDGRRLLAGAAGGAAHWPRRLSRRPVPVLAAGTLIALIGWAAGTRIPVQSDITRLVPASMPSLRDLRTLERATGSSGEIDVLVHGGDVATPAVVGWMVGYEQRLLSHFGYGSASGCRTATLCPALSLPGLLGAGAGAVTQGSINNLLTAVPKYLSGTVITPDRRYAVLAFGLRLMPLARQERVVDYMRRQLRPPAGTSAELAGLPVLAADAGATLSSPWRRLELLLAGLLAVAAVLAGVLRNPRRVLVPLATVALASGWASLLVYLTGIPLNPMSAALGTLVLAIATEFSVLVSERILHERRSCPTLAEAVARAYRSTGSAVLASGLTAIAGFGALMLSDIEMLRDFGIVTVIDLAASLAGVLLVLPALVEVAGPGRHRARRPDAHAAAPETKAEPGGTEAEPGATDAEPGATDAEAGGTETEPGRTEADRPGTDLGSRTPVG